MKTLAVFTPYNEFIYNKIEFMREVYESNLIQVIESIRDNKVSLKVSAKGKITGTIRVSFNGKRWTYNRVVPDIHRIIAMIKKSPASTSVPDLQTLQEKYDWIKANANDFLNLGSTVVGRAMLFQAAQVPEKGVDKEYRTRFEFGMVGGVFIPGKVHEVLQAEEFERCGGCASIQSADSYTIDQSGEIVAYSKANRSKSSKKLDQLYKGQYINFYTTNKAHTAELDGGGRTSEYEADAGKTISKRTVRFQTNGYEINDGRVVLLGALVDSRFFAGPMGPNALRLMQTMANNRDTFVINAATLAKFMTLIDVPEVLTDTANVINRAFNQLAVEI